MVDLIVLAETQASLQRLRTWRSVRAWICILVDNEVLNMASSKRHIETQAMQQQQNSYLCPQRWAK